MRITHFGNVAGVSTTLAKYQRKDGHFVSVLVRGPHPFGYPGEKVYESNLSRFTNASKEILSSKIVHYHDETFLSRTSRSVTFLLDKADYRLAKMTRKNIVFHFHGSIREPLVQFRDSEFFREKLIVSTPDLLPYVPSRARWVPNPADVEMFKPNHRVGSEEVRVGFYEPVEKDVRRISNPDKVRQLILQLKNTRALPAYNVPWEQMPNYFNSLDIWIDKISLDFYGISACEAASCGLPVVTHVGENEMSFIPDCPFLNSNWEKLSEAIEYLSEENTRRYVGRKCL